jgi:hypothetical protein
LTIGIYLAFLKVDLSKHVADLITTVSIIGGFLFNLLAIIYGLMDKLEEEASNNILKKIFAKEIHINISFNILLSLFLLIALIIYSYLGEVVFAKIWQKISYYALKSTIYFLIILFFLTMLMILNRIYILLKRE